MNLKEIKRLIAIVEESKLSHFSIESDGTKIEIKKENTTVVTQVAAPQMTTMLPAQAAAPISDPASTPSEPVVDKNLKTITAQMVGTFYSAPNPEADPYVSIGSSIKSGQTICVIEAMKLFNEIEAEFEGTIEKICVNNADPVEYGQDLFIVRVN
ncbi:acetyl-CoA carboxylase biotin carboxyl carrier protein [bacterium]|jgi:acetyl-CoA carboxylase biotin carboxyl carrier protein|nr:acetyl-CoA carboxylase biotin carboxyl carrier protein [bacterium]